jgi:hypothetical protein
MNVQHVWRDMGNATNVERGTCALRKRAGNLSLSLSLRMVSSGMLRRVALVRTDVSEERSASFIGVTRIGELGKTLALTSNKRIISSQHASVASYGYFPSSLFLVTLIKEALSSSETSVLTRATRRNIPEGTILHSHRREQLKPLSLSYTQTPMYTHTHTQAPEHTHTHRHARTHTDAHTHRLTHKYSPTHTPPQTPTYTKTHTYTHTHTDTCSLQFNLKQFLYVWGFCPFIAIRIFLHSRHSPPLHTHNYRVTGRKKDTSQEVQYCVGHGLSWRPGGLTAGRPTAYWQEPGTQTDENMLQAAVSTCFGGCLCLHPQSVIFYSCQRLRRIQPGFRRTAHSGQNCNKQ